MRFTEIINTALELELPHSLCAPVDMSAHSSIDIAMSGYAESEANLERGIPMGESQNGPCPNGIDSPKVMFSEPAPETVEGCAGASAYLLSKSAWRSNR